MTPEERENRNYLKGYQNPIDMEEEVMFSSLPLIKGGKLLDVGCGEGTISLELQKRGFEVYGLDFSSVAVRKAKEKGINAIECNVDKDGLPFEDNYFDIVWAGDVIEHVFDPIFLLSEIGRLVKSKGKIFISVPNEVNLMRRISLFVTGKSHQSDIYRQLRQCKHHTLFSLELIEYMLDEVELSWKYIGFTIRFPKFKRRRFSSNYLLGKLFGETILIEASKK